MNFRVLDGDIYFSEEFIKLHEIREQFLQDAFNCVLNLREEFFNKFKTVEQLLKDGETFADQNTQKNCSPEFTVSTAVQQEFHPVVAL